MMPTMAFSSWNRVVSESIAPRDYDVNVIRGCGSHCRIMSNAAR